MPDDNANDVIQLLRHRFQSWATPVAIADESSQLPNEPDVQKLSAMIAHGGWTAVETTCGILFPPLPLIDDTLFSYLLPGLLIAALRDDAWWEFILGLVNRIAEPWRKGAKPRLGIVVTAFSDEQLDAVVEALRLISRLSFDDYPNIQRRIDAIIVSLQGN